MRAGSAGQLEFHAEAPGRASFLHDVLAGLRSRPRRLAPKYFYDEDGSRLFDAICQTPEYYPTRTESAILAACGDALAARLGSGCVLLEPGGGSCTKVRTLLERIRPQVYVPIDISGEHLRRAVGELAGAFPWLPVQAVAADFTRPASWPDTTRSGRRVVFFPGSSIGNFEPEAAQAFIREVRGVVGADGALLIGVDLKKDPAVLHAAYNDAQGITAAFNRNLLARINRELGADFCVSGFEHLAFYNESAGRVEMHLVSSRDQTVSIGGERLVISAGERIHTENSYKYSMAEFRGLAEQAGFCTEEAWTDAQELFGVFLFRGARTG